MTLADTLPEPTNPRTEALVAFGLALMVAVLIKIPALFGINIDENEGFYILNMSLFVLPLLAAYFAWKRRLESRIVIRLFLAFAAAAIIANTYPFDPGGDTEVLLALHLPIALWLIIGIAFSGGRWDLANERMDFIRFSGELFIYYVLIALGGGVLTGFMALIFGTIEIDIEPFFESWLLPCGAAGAVIVASWLVESRKKAAAHIAPVLARIFTPLFAIMLITFLGVLLWSGRGMTIDRNVLIAFDMLLVAVLCLLLFGISARDPQSPPGTFDMVQFLLVASALLADAVALWGISGRIAEFGFTPNRMAALGMNVILLFNLGWSAVLYIRFLRGDSSITTLERWQTNYLPVYSVWAAVVAIIFPILFGFS